MDFVDLIIKKRDNKKLSKDEINYFIKGVTDGTIPDYQISSMFLVSFISMVWILKKLHNLQWL